MYRTLLQWLIYMRKSGPWLKTAKEVLCEIRSVINLAMTKSHGIIRMFNPHLCLPANERAWGLVQCKKDILPLPIVEIRQSYDRLISTVGFPILISYTGKMSFFCIESGP